MFLPETLRKFPKALAISKDLWYNQSMNVLPPLFAAERGYIHMKINSKNTAIVLLVLAGVLILGIAFGSAYFVGPATPAILMNVLFALAGIGWATINVNSFPMVVEMCSGSDVGKYTGFYYTASMTAQIVTPMLSGMLMDQMGMTVLFPYASVFVALAFVTMLLVRHGDAKVLPKKGVEALVVED